LSLTSLYLVVYLCLLMNSSDLIKSYRKKAGLTMDELALELDKSKGYLSRIESGNARPSAELLFRLTETLKIPEDEVKSLLSNFEFADKEMEDASVKVKLKQSQVGTAPQGVRVKINKDLKVLYSDSAMINSNAFGFQINFAQMLPATSVHDVVARIGMSGEHVKSLIDALGEELKAYNKNRKKNARANTNTN